MRTRHEAVAVAVDAVEEVVGPVPELGRVDAVADGFCTSLLIVVHLSTTAWRARQLTYNPFFSPALVWDAYNY